MLNLLLVIAVFAGLAWAFVELTRRFGEREVSVWTALGILGIARIASRLLTRVVPDTDATPKFGVALAIYFVALTTGLIWAAGVRPLVAMGLAVAVSLAAILVPLVFIWTGVV